MVQLVHVWTREQFKDKNSVYNNFKMDISNHFLEIALGKWLETNQVQTGTVC